MSKSNVDCNIVIKLDVAKTYNRMGLNFLIEVEKKIWFIRKIYHSYMKSYF